MDGMCVWVSQMDLKRYLFVLKDIFDNISNQLLRSNFLLIFLIIILMRVNFIDFHFAFED